MRRIGRADARTSPGRVVAALALALALVGGVDALDRRREGARERDASERFVDVAMFERCGVERVRSNAGEVCFEHVVRGATEDGTCEIERARLWRADGTEVERACGRVDAGASRVVVRLRVDEACRIEANQAVRVEAAVECASGDARLFQFSTMLLGEVVALADAAVYLADSVHTLEETIEIADEVLEDERATEVTIWWPASF